MKWWQRKTRGWIVPFWYSDTPLWSKRWHDLPESEKERIVNEVRNQKLNNEK